MEHASGSHVLRTKLYCPRVASDAVVRESLLAVLDKGLDLPLTLVSAPAGYGKSTLVSQWLERSDVPSAWVSLEESENETRIFLEYLLTAVRGLHGDCCDRAWALLDLAELPPAGILERELTSGLDRIPSRFVLVLDDFHAVTDLVILRVIDFLLGQAPRSLHLVLISRRDPMLSLSRYRARHQMNEVRLADLRFELDDSATFLRHSVKTSLTETDIERLHAMTEGWPVALRLAAGAIRRQGDLEELLRDGRAGGQKAQEFLLEEVLERQPEDLRTWLRKTAILPRICSGLADVLSPPVRPEPGPDRRGATPHRPRPQPGDGPNLGSRPAGASDVLIPFGPPTRATGSGPGTLRPARHDQAHAGEDLTVDVAPGGLGLELTHIVHDFQRAGLPRPAKDAQAVGAAIPAGSSAREGAARRRQDLDC